MGLYMSAMQIMYSSNLIYYLGLLYSTDLAKYYDKSLNSVWFYKLNIDILGTYLLLFRAQSSVDPLKFPNSPTWILQLRNWALRTYYVTSWKPYRSVVWIHFLLFLVWCSFFCRQPVTDIKTFQFSSSIVKEHVDKKQF